MLLRVWFCLKTASSHDVILVRVIVVIAVVSSSCDCGFEFFVGGGDCDEPVPNWIQKTKQKKQK